ncbi:MAG: hypothetical protein IKD86_04860, partial [Firmicutes bacterium]|nr:hypothetical protein [Bacillota bacterium]
RDVLRNSVRTCSSALRGRILRDELRNCVRTGSTANRGSILRNELRNNVRTGRSVVRGLFLSDWLWSILSGTGGAVIKEDLPKTGIAFRIRSSVIPGTGMK